MSKEINPGLFSNHSSNQSSNQSSSVGFAENGQQECGPRLSFDPSQIFRNERAVDKIELRKLDEKFSLKDDRSQEVIKTLSLKIEKMGQRLVNAEQRLETMVNEVRGKYAQLSGKISEKGLHEQEVHALIERHNQLVRNFENRLAQNRAALTSWARALSVSFAASRIP